MRHKTAFVVAFAYVLCAPHPHKIHSLHTDTSHNQAAANNNRSAEIPVRPVVGGGSRRSACAIHLMQTDIVNAQVNAIATTSMDFDFNPAQTHQSTQTRSEYYRSSRIQACVNDFVSAQNKHQTHTTDNMFVFV